MCLFHLIDWLDQDIVRLEELNQTLEKTVSEKGRLSRDIKIVKSDEKTRRSSL